MRYGGTPRSPCTFGRLDGWLNMGPAIQRASRLDRSGRHLTRVFSTAVESAKRLDDGSMNVSVRSHATFIAQECPTHTEIEVGSPNIGHPSARLLDNDGACSLIPDLVAEIRSGRKPQQEVRFPGRDHRMLGLAVHQHRRNLDSQRSKDFVERVEVDVVTFN